MEKVTLERLSFRRNFSWSFVGNLVYCGCMGVMLMAMTKLLPAEKVGIFILSTAIITPIEAFTNMNLRAVQGSDAKDEFCFGEYFALRILTVVVMLISAIIISTFLGKGVEMVLIMVAVILYKSADCYADITYGLLQKYERLDKVAMSRIVRGIIGCTIFVLIIWLTRNIVLGFLGVTLAWAGIFILLDISSVRQFQNPMPRFKKDRLFKLTTISIPVGITMAIASLNVNIPRYFTEKYLGSEELAYFGSLAYIIAGLGTATVAIYSAALPRLSRYYIENIRAYVKLLAKMIVVAAFIGLSGVIFGLLLGSRFIATVYTTDYAEYKTLFLWLLTAGGIGYVSAMLCVGLTSARLFKVQVPLLATVTLVTLLSSWALIPRFGVVGGAWAMLIGSSALGTGALAIIIWNIVLRTKRTGVKSE